MKTLIAVPCMDYLEADFVESLLNLRHVGECDTLLLKSSLVYDARNQAAQKAVAEGYDYVLWIDSDMTFEPDMMERMFESLGDKNFITGLCFSRRPPFKPCVFKKIEVTHDGIAAMPHAENWFDYNDKNGKKWVAKTISGAIMKDSVFRDRAAKNTNKQEAMNKMNELRQAYANVNGALNDFGEIV